MMLSSLLLWSKPRAWSSSWSATCGSSQVSALYKAIFPAVITENFDALIILLGPPSPAMKCPSSSGSGAMSEQVMMISGSVCVDWNSRIVFSSRILVAARKSLCFFLLQDCARW